MTELTRAEAVAAGKRPGAADSTTLPQRAEVAAAAAAAAIGGAAVGVGAGRDALLVAAAVALCALGLFQPALFLMLVLVIRPVLDKYSESGLHIVVGTVNGAGALALLVIAVSGITIAVAGPRVWPRAAAPFGLVLLVSLGATAVGLLTTDALPRGKPVSELVRLAALAATALLAAVVAARNRVTPPILFVVVALSALVPALVGIEEWIRGTDNASGLTIGRINGTFAGANPFAEYLAIVALILVFLPRRWLPPWVRFPLLALVGVALVGTFSRSGWAMFLLGVPLLGWRNHRRMVALVFVAAAAVALAIPSVRDRLLFRDSTPTASVVAGQPTVDSNSYHWRLENWRRLLERYEERPVTGFGLRSTEYVNPTLYPTVAGDFGYTAHNTAVKLLVEGGPLLLAAWVLFFVVVIASAWRMARTSWPYQELGRIILVTWVLVVTVSLVADDLLDATALMIAVWALMGALEGAWSRRTRSPQVA